MEDIKEFILSLLKINENYIDNGGWPSAYTNGANDAYKNILDYIEGKEKINKKK